jgi:hypothetical protein
VSGKEVSVHYPGTEPVAIAARRTLHWEMAVADFVETFETMLYKVNFDNAEWIQQLWVEIFLLNCASKVWEVRRKVR